MSRREFPSASAQEIDVELQVLDGAIPVDWHGYVFINSACGTVNSNGLPHKKFRADGITLNEEFGTPLIAGDGVVIRIDMQVPGKVKVKTGLMKPPCYYADLATSESQDPTDQYKDLRFRNIGLGRRSLKLGTRNQLSTAVTPIKMGAGEPTRLLATFDAGRPFEFDPASLEIKTPITLASVWKSFLPAFMRTPFESIMSTAHPVFDPETKELYTVNFGKKRKEAFVDYLLFKLFVQDEVGLKRFLRKTVEKIAGGSLEEKIKKAHNAVQDFLLFSLGPDYSWLHRIIDPIRKFFLKIVNKLLFNKNGLYLIRWTGQKESKKWEVLENGNAKINLSHNMHQIGFSRDFVILCDTNFKFTFDTMMDLPFQDEHEICTFFRTLMSVAMNHYSSLFIIKRIDLLDSRDTVSAKRVHLDVETVHFSVDYDNPNGEITLHSAHNCSACVADWLRDYDRLAVNPSMGVREEKLGLLAVGEMDISKIGRIVVNGNTGALVPAKTKFLHLDGIQNGKVTLAHTWGIGLYTYRDILSPEKNLPKIDHVYWQSYGLNEEHLTQFIHDLYKNSKRNRVFSPSAVFDLTKKGAPPVLQCVDTHTMTSVDFFAFGEEQYMWSLQFVPRKNQIPGVPDSKNGYILTTVIHGEKVGPSATDGYNYLPEIWVFDADKLHVGPVCKLGHGDFSFGFTIHSVWVEEAVAVAPGPYSIDVREDYDPILEQVKGKRNKERLKGFFEQHVYPYF